MFIIHWCYIRNTYAKFSAHHVTIIRLRCSIDYTCCSGCLYNEMISQVFAVGFVYIVSALLQYSDCLLYYFQHGIIQNQLSEALHLASMDYEHLIYDIRHVTIFLGDIF